MSTDEVQIKRSWVEHVTTKSGEEKLNFRIYYFDELSHKWRKKGKRILKDTPQARRKALNELKRDIKRNYDRFSTQSYTLGKLRDAYIEHVASGESSLRYQTAYQYEANVNHPRLKSGACSSRLTKMLTSSSNVTISYSYLHVTTSSGY